MSTTAEVEGLLRGRPMRSDELIAILQDIQERFHYLPEDALRAVARRLRIPLTQVFHVATFYNCFSLEPRGRHHVRVCLGTACHVRGGQRILEKVLRELKLPASGTTPDFDFTVEPVRCLGCCGLAPVVRVDTTTFGHMMQSRIPKLLKRYSSRKEEAA
ncbi:MAG TPA: NAD(P)H-dependent oxidoreductase subunit E [Candidatus Xenobia bacterium]|nr:NAD(P)H-dependent oxidoreductase subunit E [Candidatus Xenobia bacterium]